LLCIWQRPDDKKGEIMNKQFQRNAAVAYILFLLVFAIVVVPSLIGVSDVWNAITGWAATSSTSLILRINAIPTISVSATTSTVTITEDGRATSNFTFTVTDLDGIAEIDNATAFLRINLTNQTDRVNHTCAGNGTIGLTTYSYKCQVEIWYWDAAGNWTINASVRDVNGAYAQNITQTFEVYSTAAITISPRNLTWPTIELGATNQTSNADPVIINNTGNKRIDIGGVNVIAYSLQGAIRQAEFIDARNFTVSPRNGSVTCTGNGCFECNGTTMLNGTSTAIQTPIITANISTGNHTISNLFNETGPQESLFFCLRTVPDGTQITAQVYGTNSTHTDMWTVAVS